MYQVLTNSGQQTKKIGQELGERIGKFLRNNSESLVIALSGELGSGKTTFIKGIASGLGIKKPITSPTFTLLKEYKNKGINLYHFDFYRLKNIDDALGIGLAEYLKKPGGISVIEWADRIEKLLPEEKLIIEFDFISQNQRKLTFKPKGNKYKKLINFLFTNT